MLTGVSTESHIYHQYTLRSRKTGDSERDRTLAPAKIRTFRNSIQVLFTAFLATVVVLSPLSAATNTTDIAPVDNSTADDASEGYFTAGERADHYNETSHRIQKMLDEYDIRLRPGFSGPALTLEMDILVASFDEVSEVDMDYTITIYLHQYWRDDRLAWSNERNESITMSGDFAEAIWVPDVFLANDKQSFIHQVTEVNKMLRLYSDGYIAYGMRFTTTLACNMDLRYYPLDSQTCTLEIESYGYTTDDIVMEWKHGDESIRGVYDVTIPQFTILGYRTYNKIATTATGAYQRLSLVFVFQRNIGYFIFQTYLPCILIVMLSWVSFWINHDATSARVSLGITTVLTMTTISTGVRASLPRISYIKAIDIYLVMCFVFVFVALLEYAAVNYTYWGSKTRRKQREGADQKTDNTSKSNAKANNSNNIAPGANKNRNNRKHTTNEDGIAAELEPWESITESNDYSTALCETNLDEVPNNNNNTLSISNANPGHAAHPAFTVHRTPSGRLSPIESLRYPGFNAEPAEAPIYPRTARYAKTEQYTPSSSTIRRRRGNGQTGSGYGISLGNRRHIGRHAGGGFVSVRPRGSRLLHSVRSNAQRMRRRIRIEDINVIDQYSRWAFPTTFILFNIFYWCFYSFTGGEPDL